MQHYRLIEVKSTGESPKVFTETYGDTDRASAQWSHITMSRSVALEICGFLKFPLCHLLS